MNTYIILRLTLILVEMSFFFAVHFSAALVSRKRVGNHGARTVPLESCVFVYCHMILLLFSVCKKTGPQKQHNTSPHFNCFFVLFNFFYLLPKPGEKKLCFCTRACHFKLIKSQSKKYSQFFADVLHF